MREEIEERTFKMVAGKQKAKTRIPHIFLWQWGWVQIRSCGRGLRGLRMVLEGRRGGTLSESCGRGLTRERGGKELWELVGARGETDPVKLL